MSASSSCVCVRCGHPQSHLYLQYPHGSVLSAPCDALCDEYGSPAAAAPSPTHTQPATPTIAQRKRPADPYIENSGIIVFLDLVLVKPRAFRHLLCNRPLLNLQRAAHADGAVPAKGRPTGEIVRLPDVKISAAQAWSHAARLFLAVQLVDAFLRWYYLCAYGPPASHPAELLVHPRLTSLLPDPGGHRSVLNSYLSILAAVLLESLTLNATVTLILTAYTALRRRFGGKSATLRRSELFRPHLVVNALVLANVSTYFLLSLILLWESRYQLHRTDLPTRRSQGLDSPLHAGRAVVEHLADRLRSFQPDTIIRHLVASLSSGVALAVVFPRSPLVTTTSILAGWAVAAHVRSYTLLPGSSGEDTARSPAGVLAAPYFCPSWS